MQTLRRSVFNISNVNKQFTRSVAPNNVDEKTTENLKSWQEIPGPSSLPLIGQLHHFLPGGTLSNRNDFTTDLLYRTYGPIVRFDGIFGSPAMILLYDAESASQVLRGENWSPVRPGFGALEYHRRSVNEREGDPDAPTGLITDHGDAWKNLRSAVNPVMLQPKTVKLYNKVIKEVAVDMITRMRQIRNDKNMLEGKFDVEMNLWALESIGVVALGRRLNCFDPNLPDDSPAKELIKLVHESFSFLDKLEFGPSIWRYFATPTFKRAMKCYDELLKYNLP